MQTSLTCSGNGALINGGNVNRHYETKHSLFEQSYPLKSKLKYENLEIGESYKRQAGLGFARGDLGGSQNVN